MTADTAVASELGIYVCPVCKGLLRQDEGVLRCPNCSQTYPMFASRRICAGRNVAPKAAVGVVSWEENRPRPCVAPSLSWTHLLCRDRRS
jgi:DNA-directed RNA polymerase subunit RPC12/RpoP